MTPIIRSRHFALGVAAASLAAFGAAAHAAEPGAYMGASTGVSKFSVDKNSNGNTDTVPNWGLYGGYNFSKHLGVEVGYQDLGRAKIDGHGSGSSAHTRALGIDLVGYVPVAQKLDLYGKLGLAHYAREVDGAVGSETKNGAGLKYGLGAQYAATERLSIRAELSVFTNLPEAAAPGQSYKSTAGQFSLGAQYRF